MAQWTFDGQTVTVLSDSRDLDEALDAGLPWGGIDDIIRSGGFHSRRVTVRALLTYAQKDALQTRYLAATVGALIDHRSVSYSARIVPPFIWTEVPGLSPAGYVEASITFIKRP